MNILQAITLGLVQGATEFIPVSSSGHLVLVPWLLGWEFDPQSAFVFDVLVQWGTLVALFACFWRELWAVARGVVRGLAHRHPLETAEARLGWLLVVATLPAVVLGLVLKEAVEQAFSSPIAVSLFLLMTALLLTLSERLGRRTRGLASLGWFDALWIGLSQVLALFPGLSRSGATIAGGLTRDLERPAAARFSFLMSVPALLGAGVVAGRDLLAAPDLGAQVGVVGVGFLAAAVSGYLCIWGLLRYLQRGRLYPFAAYCLLMGVSCLVVALLR